MTFASATYGLFLLAAVGLFWACRGRARLRHFLLLLASYYFYATWNAWYLVLILFSTLLDFFVGRQLTREALPTRRKLLLAASVVGNLGVLATFKYYNFFADSISAVAQSASLPFVLAHSHLLLPVGISFYTFQSLSYSIDVYRGKTEPARDILDFSLFIAFFPQLVAGPIVRADQFLPQLSAQPRWDDDRASQGIYRILKGLFKKVIFADLIGSILADPVFASPGEHQGLVALIGIYAYAIQIYADFSAYTDIAIGSGRLLGFKLPENFDMPYLATNLRDFWRRWHISLSTWLRDYLYIPLGGSRRGALRTYFSLFVTMLLGGLWHGANWTFVLWGAFHGCALAVTRVSQRALAGRQAERSRPKPWTVFATRVLTFHVVCLGWVLFRSADFDTAWRVLQSLFVPGESLMTFATAHREHILALLMLACAFLTILVPQRWKPALSRAFVTAPPAVQAAAAAAVIVFLAAFGQTGVPFIYYQF